MKKIAIIGSGISGVSLAQMLNKNYQVDVYEALVRPGGLIACDVVDGYLYHKVGGHVFNTKNQQVNDWFWSFFDRENEFLKAKRKAKILFGGKTVGYPIENYLFELDDQLVSNIIADLLKTSPEAKPLNQYTSFREFLIDRFGPSLYHSYFEPYNQKIWQTDPANISMEWLDGKFPQPNLKELLLANILKKEEETFVHSWFYYPKNNGSQFIIDRLLQGVNVITGQPVTQILLNPDGTKTINNTNYHAVVYTGDIRQLQQTLDGADVPQLPNELTQLRANGTTNALCLTDPTDLSWMYIPEGFVQAHRIIYTGNLSPNNNKPNGRLSCVVEFSGKFDEDFVREQITKLPGNLEFVKLHYKEASYVVQGPGTRDYVKQAKQLLAPKGVYLLGRFGEWEYYNMDKAIEAAFALMPNVEQYLQN